MLLYLGEKVISLAARTYETFENTKTQQFNLGTDLTHQQLVFYNEVLIRFVQAIHQTRAKSIYYFRRCIRGVRKRKLKLLIGDKNHTL